MTISVFAQTPAAIGTTSAVDVFSSTASAFQIVAFAYEFGGTGAGGTMTDNRTVNNQGWTKVAVVNNGNVTLSAFVQIGQFGNTAGTITYTATAGATQCAFLCTMLQGGVGDSHLIRQVATNSGGIGVLPSTTFANPSVATSAILTSLGDNDSGIGSTIPSGYTSGSSQTTTNTRIEAAFLLNAASGTTAVTWTGAETTPWAVISLEVNGVAIGTFESPTSWQAAQPTHAAWNYNLVSGARPNAQFRSPPMFSVDVQQNVPVEVRVYLRDKITLLGWTGSASQIVVQTQPSGASFGTITPSSVVVRGNGWVSLFLTGAQVGAPGLMPIHVIANDTQGLTGSLPSDDVVLNVVAIDGGQIKANTIIDLYTYGTGAFNKLPLTWRVRVFASETAANAATPGHANGADGEVERYLGAATYNVDSTLASYSFVKDL